jgi:hypothetical protein
MIVLISQMVSHWMIYIFGCRINQTPNDVFCARVIQMDFGHLVLSRKAKHEAKLRVLNLA